MKKFFAIHDKAVNSYSAPAVISSERDAIEAFKASIANPESSHHKHSADYTLVCIGEYDEFTGVITPYADKHIVVNGSSLKQELLDATNGRNS
nr:MAG: nonstructural protein [Microvirus sp.]